MLKQIFIIGFFLVSLIGYTQKSKLIPNVNVRAKELKHRLNSEGDSLILESKQKIYTVKISNTNFKRKIHVKDTKITIPLNDVPIGKFLVEATLVDKLIVITLLRNKPFNDLKDARFKDKKLTQGSVPRLEEITETENSINNESSAMSITSTINKGKDQNSLDKIAFSHSTVVKSCWVEYNINNGHNS